MKTYLKSNHASKMLCYRTHFTRKLGVKAVEARNIILENFERAQSANYAGFKSINPVKSEESADSKMMYLIYSLGKYFFKC